jgi:3-deoxy-manno-octulosonate cytidylyltransferase (CMP-KDO synthetase)
VGIIPARWASTRFPGKPLHPVAGKPLVQHVWERCQTCRMLDRVAIATDDPRIAEAAQAFGAEAVMTSPDHPSGTDRVAEAARHLGGGVTHVINIQGDEPLIDPGLVDQLAAALLDDPELPMVTAAHPLADAALAENPNVVKAVVASDGTALYFSRAPVPYAAAGSRGGWLRHEGIYGYRLETLMALVSWPPSPLERRERLEQLRALENGLRIRVLLTAGGSVGVDTPDQVATVEPLLRQAETHGATTR